MNAKQQTIFDKYKSLADSGEIIQVSLKDITLVTDPSHPLYDMRVKEKLDPSFVEAVKNDGQDQNISLVLTSAGELLVAAGRSRFRAKESLGESTIAAKIHFTDSNVEMKKIMIRENEQRRDDNPIRKSYKVRGLFEELDREYAETNPSNDPENPSKMPDVEKYKIGMDVFGVKRNRIGELAMLAFDASPKVLKAGDKGDISAQVAIEIVRSFPGDYGKQEKKMANLLSKGKGKVKKENVKEIGERAIKGSEFAELANGALVSSSVKIGVKEFAHFASGKMDEDERNKFFEKNDWAKVWVGIDEVDNEVDEEDGDAE